MRRVAALQTFGRVCWREKDCVGKYLWTFSHRYHDTSLCCC